MPKINYPVNDPRRTDDETILPQGTDVIAVGWSPNYSLVILKEDHEQWRQAEDKTFYEYPCHRDFIYGK